MQKPSFLSDQSNELQFAERLMWIFIHLCQKMLLASASDQQKQTVHFNIVLLHNIELPPGYTWSAVSG